MFTCMFQVPPPPPLSLFPYLILLLTADLGLVASAKLNNFVLNVLWLDQSRLFELLPVIE